MPAAPASNRATPADATRPDRGVPRLPVSPQRRDEDLARATRRLIPRQGRRVIYSLLALIVIAVTGAGITGVRDASAMQEAANAQYRSITGEGGYDVDGYGIWGNCAAASMTDGRTAILTKTDGDWLVVRHSTYTDGYDLDSVTSADTCNQIAADPQAPSHP